MTKKAFTFLFVIAATVVNLVMTVAVIVALALVATLLLRVVLHVQSPDIIMLSWMICFIGGLVLDIVLYSKICDKVIEKFNLSSKLDPRLLGRRSSAFRAKVPQRQEPEKPKTVLPKSVLPDEEADHWGEE